MSLYRFKPVRFLRGTIFLPGDKSIAHRSLIISAIAKGKTRVYNFPANQDCITTLKALKQLGVRITMENSQAGNKYFCIEGKGLYGLRKPRFSVFAGESGTTFRLLLGVLAGQQFPVNLTAAKALARRPMRRITEPLRRMGAIIKARKIHSTAVRRHGAAEEYPPITIKGGRLRRISYKMPVASAQVKSALLLAGLYAAGGISEIFESVKTRDHTERMLRDFGAKIKIKDKTIFISGQKELLSPGVINIPGDISSASFFIVAAVLLPDSAIVIKSVGINPTRLGLIRVLKRMGANIKVARSRLQVKTREPAGDIIIKSSSLKGIKIKASEVPQLIDELPILMLAFCYARGRTIIYGVEELRVKETDRIVSMQANLSKMGAEIRVVTYRSKSAGLREKMIIQGISCLRGARVSSFNDHRTAMSMIIAGLVSTGETVIDEVECIAKSFPGFLEILKGVVK